MESVSFVGGTAKKVQLLRSIVFGFVGRPTAFPPAMNIER